MDRQATTPPEPMRPTALITGAAGGIGAACAATFLDEGWNVVGWDRAHGTDARVSWSAVDVTDWDAVGALASTLPPISAAIQCAGVSSREPAASLTQAEWDRVIAVNLSASFYVARWIYPSLAAAKGVLINIASITADSGFRDRSVYSVTKAGIVTLSRQLAIEWAQAGVRVLSVSPGFTGSPMLAEGIDAGRTATADILRHTPQGRILEASELAAAIFALAGPAFSGLTGSQVVLDGGFNAYTGF